MSNIPNYKRGFTLLETFVAITILVIAVIGPLSLMIRGITDGNYAKNEITAFYIAQEGLELVINKRDANQFTPAGSLGGYAWLRELSECEVNNETESGCHIDAQSFKITKCASGGTCPPFVFADGSLNTANFVRDIKIIHGTNTITGQLSDGSDIPPGLETQQNQAEVIVTVTWENKNAPRTLVLKDIIYARPAQQ